jgi:hypothetical protein
MVMIVVVVVLVLVAAVRVGIAAVGMRVAHYPRMTEEPCCSTFATTPRPRLQPGRARGDRSNPRLRHPL